MLKKQPILLPEGKTWKTHCDDLLSQLPVDIKKNYISRFKKFINHWKVKGSPFDPDMADKLKHTDCIEILNKQNRLGKIYIKFKYVPDTILFDDVTDMCSWRRMCLTVAKNDVYCKSLGFSKPKLKPHKNLLDIIEPTPKIKENVVSIKNIKISGKSVDLELSIHLEI